MKKLIFAPKYDSLELAQMVVKPKQRILRTPEGKYAILESKRAKLFIKFGSSYADGSRR